MKSSYTRIVLGGIVVFLGVGLLLEQFNISQLGNVLSYFWPLALCTLGLVLLVGESRRLFLGGLFFLVGLLLIVSKFFNLDINIWNLWPLFFVVIGLKVLFPREERFPGNFKNGQVTTSNKDTVDVNVLFWGENRKIASNNFKGGNVTVIFGGAELDLRDAKFENGKAKLNIVNTFGGTVIHLSPNTKLSNEGTGVFGAFDDKHMYNPSSKEEQILTITGFCAFGGVEVK